MDGNARLWRSCCCVIRDRWPRTPCRLGTPRLIRQPPNSPTTRIHHPEPSTEIREHPHLRHAHGREGHRNSDSARDQVLPSSSLDLLRLRGQDGESRLSTGPDTCFVNIVWNPFRSWGNRRERSGRWGAQSRSHAREAHNQEVEGTAPTLKGALHSDPTPEQRRFLLARSAGQEPEEELGRHSDPAGSTGYGPPVTRRIAPGGTGA